MRELTDCDFVRFAFIESQKLNVKSCLSVLVIEILAKMILFFSFPWFALKA